MSRSACPCRCGRRGGTARRGRRGSRRRTPAASKPWLRRAHVDVVDVEQQAAVGLLGQPRQELPLGHRRGRERDVGADGFSSTSGRSRKSCTCAHARDDVRAASPRCRAAAGGRACCGRRRRSSRGGRRPTARVTRSRQRLELRAGSRSRAGRCCRSRARRRASRPGSARRSGRAPMRGRPPESMKFSEMISNQSTAGRCSQDVRRSATVRRPTPRPRSGDAEAVHARVLRRDGRGAQRRPGLPSRLCRRRLQPLRRHRAAALALAAVLAGAAVVAGLAAALALHAFLPLQSCRAAAVAQPPLPLHEFLPAQPLSPVLQPPWPLHAFMALAGVLRRLVVRGERPRAAHHLRPGGEARGHRAHCLRELTTPHALLLAPCRLPAAAGAAATPRERRAHEAAGGGSAEVGNGFRDRTTADSGGSILPAVAEPIEPEAAARRRSARFGPRPRGGIRLGP